MVVLRGGNFRKLFAVRLVSQASDGAFQVGLASLVFFSTDRATTPTAWPSPPWSRSSPIP